MSSSGSYFSAAPVNFHRFLEMTRSASRSLSPERELRQMTAPSFYQTPARFAHCSAKVEGNKDRSSPSEASEFGSAAAAGLSTSPTMSGGGDTDVIHEAMAQSSMGQYGSPMYYPVTGAFYCWNQHPLELRDRQAYNNVEGVSCDFCGFTDWADTPPEDEEPVPKGKRGRRSTVPQGQPPANSSSRLLFYHCGPCGVDLCVACMAEVAEDVRRHVPCMQCSSCHTYVSLQDAAVHSCSSVRSTKSVMKASKLNASKKKLGSTEELRTPSRVAPPTARRRVEHTKKEKTSVLEALPSTSRIYRPPAKSADSSSVPLLAVKAVWEVLVMVDNDRDLEEAYRVADDMILDAEVQSHGLMFQLPTRLAAEKCARRAHDAGLLTSLRKVQRV